MKKQQLVVLVKSLIHQSARSDWTSELVRASVEYRMNIPYQYNPEDAPKAPPIQSIRSALKVLGALGDIAVTTHQEGPLRYNTYERIIPEPLIKIEYRRKHYRPGMAILLFVYVAAWLTGWVA